MRSETYIYRPVIQHQARTLVLHGGAKTGGGDGHRAAIFLAASREVERVQFVRRAGGEFGVHIQGATGEINHRGAGDADDGRQITARGGVGGAEIHVPVGDAGGVRVEGVNTVVFRADKDHVVDPAGEAQVLDVQRLSIDLAIHGIGEQPAEGARIDAGGGQNGFIGVGPGAGQVVVLGEHVRGASRPPGQERQNHHGQEERGGESA